MDMSLFAKNHLADFGYFFKLPQLNSIQKSIFTCGSTLLKVIPS